MPRTLLFFEGSTAATGAELFATDGTPGGTGLVQNIVPGTAGSNPANITATGAGEVVFTAADPVTGQPELFASNGTSAGTGEINGTFVNVANPTTHAIYTVRSLFSDFTPVGNGAVLFVGTNNGAYTQLWTTNGAASGTQPLGIFGQSNPLGYGGEPRRRLSPHRPARALHHVRGRRRTRDLQRLGLARIGSARGGLKPTLR